MNYKQDEQVLFGVSVMTSVHDVSQGSPVIRGTESLLKMKSGF